MIIGRVSAGTTKATLGEVVLSNANAVSFGVDGQTVTASIPAGATATGNLGGLAAGTQTATSGTVVLSDSNQVSFGMSGSTRVTASYAAPRQVSIAGGNTMSSGTLQFASSAGNISWGMSTDANGGTITASAPGGGGGATMRSLAVIQPVSSFSLSNANMSWWPVSVPGNLTVTRLNFLAHMSGASGSTGGYTLSAGLYTIQGSTASLASSGSTTKSWTSGSNSTASTANFYGNQSGTRYREMTVASWQLTPGHYLFGLWSRSTNAGTWSFWGHWSTISLVSEVYTSITAEFLPGYSTSSFSTAMPASLNVTNTQYVRTGASAYRFPALTMQGSV